jgi:hypothetical protein
MKARVTNHAEELKKKQKIDPKKLTGIKRCGFSWDDAAAKMGPNCSKTKKCFAPPHTFMDPDSYWFMTEYNCYNDLPDLGVRFGGRTCRATSEAATDSWCNDNCNSPDTWCDAFLCDCDGPNEDVYKFKTPEVFEPTAPIADHDPNIQPKELPNRTADLVAAVRTAAKMQPSGLPECTWRPSSKSCKNISQYECIEGAKANTCSGHNWFDRPNECPTSCIHTSLLRPAPYYALWFPGPLAKDFSSQDKLPRYRHTASKLSLRARGIDLRQSEVMMSAICRNNDNEFVGISLYSPKYKEKAMRLLRSCARVGVCCKATLLPADAFGPGAPEGSEGFRFETIASKPSFILDQLETTQLPVVFLDTDLEFHQFPELFVPGSWPYGGRDVAIFNYWGNETDYAHASTPTTGSGVVFFNTTQRAKKVLRAWAESMAWQGNTRVPDDQALDKLLKEGGWITRASYGWLPASYLRTMPAYYRGIVPVIDHDHGSAPGLIQHSTAKPVLPPVENYEAADPDGTMRTMEPAPIPRAPEPEEVPAAPAPVEEIFKKLPAGTCHSKNQDLTANDAAQQIWDNWCDENCVEEKWGGIGQGGCRETGNVQCECKQGVKPVLRDGPATRFESTEVPKPEPPQLELPPGAVVVPPGACKATNPTLTGDARKAWNYWCAQNCRPPDGRPEHCLHPAMTGVAMCVCKPSE